MLTYSTARKIRARFEHSNFLKVNGPGPRRREVELPHTPPPPFDVPTRVNEGDGAPEGGGGRAGTRRARGGPGSPHPEIQLRAF